MRAYVTTSWDDGGAYDARMAELLHEYDLKGTFYWTLESGTFPLPDARDRGAILDLDMEVGSHTMTHPNLTTIDDETLRRELVESKDRLEALTGRDVTSFCYPFGYFNERACEAVSDAGYRLGRTTMGFRKDLGSDPFHLPVTIQVYPHGCRVHVTHAAKERNWSGLGSWLTEYRASTDLVVLTRKALDYILERGGALHLWGHSWELEENDLWGVMEEILATVAHRDDVSYVTNGELMAAAGSS